MATSREIVDLLSTTPVGDRVGTVVIGPMDDASPEATDALLKTLEDLPDTIIKPTLWTEDIGMVIGTIRSRVDAVWCPPDPDAMPEAPYLSSAESLCEAALRRKTAVVIEILKENEGFEMEVLRASTVVLASKEEWPLEARLKLWDSLRSVLTSRNPTRRVILAAYLV